jgi:hypothetical protein
VDLSPADEVTGRIIPGAGWAGLRRAGWTGENDGHDGTTGTTRQDGQDGQDGQDKPVEVELTRFGEHLTVRDTEMFSESISEKSQ